jgi:lysophospholipase L1-like esterase
MTVFRKRVVLAIGILLALAGATEFSLRALCGLGSPALILRDPASGYEFRPNQHLRRFGRHIEYNSEGLRSEPLRTITAGSVRILCLGDSVTNGGAQTEQQATFPYQLEAELANSGMSVQTLNASAGGWASANEAGFLRKHGIFGAKQVVWELGTHDLFGGHALPAPSDPNFPEHAPFSATTELWSRYLWPRLVGNLKDDSPLPVSSNTEVERVACLRLLSSTVAFVQSSGARLVFLLMPEVRDFQEPGFAAVAKSDFLSEARRLGISVISPYPELLSSRKAGQNPFRDQIHPNPLGNRIVAKTVAAYLLHSDLNPRRIGASR